MLLLFAHNPIFELCQKKAVLPISAIFWPPARCRPGSSAGARPGPAGAGPEPGHVAAADEQAPEATRHGRHEIWSNFRQHVVRFRLYRQRSVQVESFGFNFFCSGSPKNYPNP